MRSRLEDKTFCAYDFGWHDFHASGHGEFDGLGHLEQGCFVSFLSLPSVLFEMFRISAGSLVC